LSEARQVVKRKGWWWVDRHTGIVVRNHRAVRLGIVQFAVFDVLHKQGTLKGKKLSTRGLADEIYRGVKDGGTQTTMHTTIVAINRKLSHLNLRIRGVNRGANSFYQIVDLTR
jgi:hypothetical protein